MANYLSEFTGQQIDESITNVRENVVKEMVVDEEGILSFNIDISTESNTENDEE